MYWVAPKFVAQHLLCVCVCVCVYTHTHTYRLGPQRYRLQVLGSVWEVPRYILENPSWCPQCNFLVVRPTHKQHWTRKIRDWDQNTQTVVIIYPPPLDTYLEDGQTSLNDHTGRVILVTNVCICINTEREVMRTLTSARLESPNYSHHKCVHVYIRIEGGHKSLDVYRSNVILVTNIHVYTWKYMQSGHRSLNQYTDAT